MTNHTKRVTIYTVKDKVSGEYLAVMANTVARARHGLSVPEQRLILWLIAQIERTDDCFREHTLTVAEMQRILGTTNGRLYEQMETLCDQLHLRGLEIANPQERTRTKFTWLHSAKYHDGQGAITLRFHDLLAPVLLELQGRFCQIPLKAIFQLRGSYAIRWLEMLMSQEHYVEWDMTVAELRDWLAIPDHDLVKTGHLVSRAIEYPRKELNEKSHLSFDFTPHRRGKSIAGWTFRVRENKPTKPARKAGKAAKKADTVSAVPVLTPEQDAGNIEATQPSFVDFKRWLKGGPDSGRTDEREEFAPPVSKRAKDRPPETPEGIAFKAAFREQEKARRRAAVAVFAEGDAAAEAKGAEEAENSDERPF